MVQVKVFSDHLPNGSEWAALEEKARLSFVIDNFAVLSDIKPGEYSLPINFPRKSVNDMIFDYFHQVDKEHRLKEYRAHVFFNGALIYAGTLNITDSSDEVYEGFLTLRAGSLTSFDLKLSEIDFGGTISIAGATYDDRLDTLAATYPLNYPDIEYCIPPIYSPQFFNFLNAQYLGWINCYDPSTGKPARNYIDNTTNLASNINAIVPMLYLQFIIEKALATDKLTLAGNFFEDDDLKKLFVYNSREIVKNYPDFKVIAEARGVPNIPDPHPLIFDTEIQDPGGYHDNALGEYTVQAEGTHYFIGYIDYDITNPNGDNNNLIFNIKESGITLAGDLFGSGNQASGNYIKPFWVEYYFAPADIGKKIKFEIDIQRFGTAAATFDLNTARITIENGSIAFLNQLPGGFNPADHVPDITFRELLEAFRDTFNISLKYDLLGHQLIIDKVEATFDQDVIDITEKTTGIHQISDELIKYKLLNYTFDESDSLSESKKDFPFTGILGSVTHKADLDSLVVGMDTDSGYIGAVGYVTSLNQFFQISAISGGNITWNFISHGWPDYVIDELNGDEEILPECSPLFMNQFPNPPAGGPENIIAPMIQQIGNSIQFNFLNGGNEFGLRLMFFWGMVNADDNATEYPLASSSNYDINGNRLGEYTLHWWGDDGLIEKFWKQWLEALQSGELYLVDLNYNLLDLVNFDINRVFRYRTRTFVMKSFQYEIGKTISPVNVEMIRIPAGVIHGK